MVRGPRRRLHALLLLLLLGSASSLLGKPVRHATEIARGLARASTRSDFSALPLCGKIHLADPFTFRSITDGIGSAGSRRQPPPRPEGLSLSVSTATGRRIANLPSVPLGVLPPWWRSPWALPSAFLLVLGAVWFAIRWHLRSIERDRLRLSTLVAERTRQLAESEQRLKMAKDAAEAANRSKSAFLASMSHELRTPLNSVLGYAQILARAPGITPSTRRGLDAIRRSGDHLLQLINEILDLAKVEAGRIELVPEPFDLAKLLASVSEALAPKAAEKGLAFAVPDTDGLPEVVLGDEPRLRQILLNLVGNAIKFTQQGAVSWTVRQTDGDLIRFEVSDTGIGIPKEEQAQVFSPFYQTAGAAALTRQGTGLGLSISEQLVRLMGGRINFRSEPGKGSCFWFDVALPITTRRESGGNEHLLDRGAILGYEGNRRRILVVDDERSNREVLQEMLTPLGFVVEEAPDAASAETAVSRQPPDLVILDLRMPEESGYDLARRWRDQRTLKGAKVIALSAGALPDQQAEALRAGCDVFLAKPFRLEHLLHAIGTQLDMSWVYAQVQAEAVSPPPLTHQPSWVIWPEADLDRLLAHTETGDALRLGDELASIARRGPAWAAAVAPWQRLAVTYQMESLSRALRSAKIRTAGDQRPTAS
jgi:signal transduction histidine kinase/CheY-like chemotaxis protein